MFKGEHDNSHAMWEDDVKAFGVKPAPNGGGGGFGGDEKGHGELIFGSQAGFDKAGADEPYINARMAAAVGVGQFFGTQAFGKVLQARFGGAIRLAIGQANKACHAAA